LNAFFLSGRDGVHWARSAESRATAAVGFHGQRLLAEKRCAAFFVLLRARTHGFEQPGNGWTYGEQPVTEASPGVKKSAPQDDSERFVSAVLLSATIDGRTIASPWLSSSLGSPSPALWAVFLLKGAN
jgi:hypothetical protein